MCSSNFCDRCKPFSSLTSQRDLSLSCSLGNRSGQAIQAMKCALWLFCLTPGNSWMLVMRPIIHSICSVSAESPHCSPAIELQGVFNPGISEEGDVFSVTSCKNTLNESPFTYCTPSRLLISRALAWTHGAPDKIEFLDGVIPLRGLICSTVHAY